jgi:hypothetical protein
VSKSRWQYFNDADAYIHRLVAFQQAGIRECLHTLQRGPTFIWIKLGKCVWFTSWLAASSQSTSNGTDHAQTNSEEEKNSPDLHEAAVDLMLRQDTGTGRGFGSLNRYSAV